MIKGLILLLGGLSIHLKKLLNFEFRKLWTKSLPRIVTFVLRLPCARGAFLREKA